MADEWLAERVEAGRTRSQAVADVGDVLVVADDRGVDEHRHNSTHVEGSPGFPQRPFSAPRESWTDRLERNQVPYARHPSADRLGHKVHDRTPARNINGQGDMFVRNHPPLIGPLAAHGRAYPVADLAPVVQGSACAVQHVGDRDIPARQNIHVSDFHADEALVGIKPPQEITPERSSPGVSERGNDVESLWGGKPCALVALSHSPIAVRQWSDERCPADVTSLRPAVPSDTFAVRRTEGGERSCRHG